MVLLDSNNMEIEDITRIIEQTLVSPDLSKINSHIIQPALVQGYIIY